MKVQVLILAIATVVKAQRFTSFHNGAKGECLTVKDGVTFDRQVLQMEACGSSDGQLWLYGAPGQLPGTISPADNSTLCITSNRDSPGGATNLKVCAGGSSQQFYFGEDNLLELGTTGFSLVANDDDGVTVSLTNTSDNGQKWSLSAIAPTEEDFFTMQNRNTSECVGYSGDAVDGNTVFASTCDGSAQQLWAYIPIIKSIVPYASRSNFGLCLSPTSHEYLLGSELLPCSGFFNERQWEIFGDYVVNYANSAKALTADDSGSLPLLDLQMSIRFTTQEWNFNHTN